MQAAALHDWMHRRAALSAAAMMKAVSATDLVKERPGFGRVVRPVAGSVLASPILAAYDPDPDYFFHWARDSAVVMDATRLLIEDGTLGPEAIRHLEDYIGFGLRLLDLDGAAYLGELGDFRAAVAPDFLQFVRDDEELRAVVGDRVQGEPRYDPDGSLDISKWSRPQHDGPATRALTLLRALPLVERLAPHTREALGRLLDADLGFTLRHWRESSYDIWEEELGTHYYTRLVQQAALADGAAWHAAQGQTARAREEARAAADLAIGLDEFWSPARGILRSRLPGSGTSAEKELDIAIVLAVIHAGRHKGPHSVLDRRVLATLLCLEDLFTALYPINRACGVDRAPAMGRYAGDHYYSGGAYYFATLGAAELYYRLAAGIAADATAVGNENALLLATMLQRAETGRDRDDAPLGPRDAGPACRGRLARGFVARGDAFLATVAAFAPPTGELAEQFDQTTGEPASAKDLAWSHAAVITAFAARRAAIDAGAR